MAVPVVKKKDWVLMESARDVVALLIGFVVVP